MVVRPFLGIESKSKHEALNELFNLITQEELPDGEIISGYFQERGITVSPLVTRTNDDLMILIDILRSISEHYTPVYNAHDNFTHEPTPMELYEENWGTIGGDLTQTIVRIENLALESRAQEVEAITNSMEDDLEKAKKLGPLIERLFRAGEEKVRLALPVIADQLLHESEELHALFSQKWKDLEPTAKNIIVGGTAALVLSMSANDNIKSHAGANLGGSANAISMSGDTIQNQIPPVASMPTITPDSVVSPHVIVVPTPFSGPELPTNNNLPLYHGMGNNHDNTQETTMTGANDTPLTLSLPSGTTPYSFLRKALYDQYGFDELIMQQLPVITTKASRYNFFFTMIQSLHQDIFMLPNGYPKTIFKAGDTLNINAKQITQAISTNPQFWLGEYTIGFGSEIEQKEAHKERAQFIQKYAHFAQEDMLESGVPASITLAQSMLESDEAKSKLSATHKNFFGIKCWGKKCPKGHCVRKYDSMEKSNDRYKIYGSAGESFKDHSKFLHRSNYDALHELEQTDYKGRAKGLKEAGYATDPNYATLLIWIIERYSLNEFDLPVESTSN